jgi:hypothetical protein
MVFKVLRETLKNIICILGGISMLGLNPNENIFMKAQEAQQPVYAVGLGTELSTTSWMQPYAMNAEPSRRTMTNNPAYTTMYPQTTTQQVQPFSSYPPAMPTSMPAVTPTGLNQNLLASTTSTGTTAAQVAFNPWNTDATQPLTMGLPTAPATVAPVPVQTTVNQFGYPTTVSPVLGNPADIIVNSYNQNWAKKDPAVWPSVAQPTPTAPMIDWGMYSNGCVNGIYAPQQQAQVQYPVQYQTTPINNDWKAICDTNFKAQF